VNARENGMKKRVIIIIIIAAIAVFAAVKILGKDRSGALTVKVAEARTGDIQSWLSTNALIQSDDVKSYYGTSGLKVTKVHVEVGDKVKKGDVLLEYDISDLETALKQAEIQYDNALLNLQDLMNQKKDIEDKMADLEAEILRLDGSDDPQDVANLQTLIQKRDSMQTISDEQIKQLNNSVSLAKISLDSARFKLNEVKGGLVADIDGTVTAVNAVEGATLAMAQPAVIVQNLDRLKGVIYLGKYDAAKIKVGQKAILEYSGNEYEGVVSFISPAASRDLTSQNATLMAEIDIINPDEHLKVDFDVNADILVGEAEDVLKIPVECIRYDKQNNTSVFVVENGVARLKQVTLGLQSESEVEILEGISPGDKVILNPSADLTDGMPVVAEGAGQ
jgi:RND family efflux transporter, MFP subunit